MRLLQRRSVLVGGVAVLSATVAAVTLFGGRSGTGLSGPEAREIDWADLVPRANDAGYAGQATLRGLVEHDQVTGTDWPEADGPAVEGRMLWDGGPEFPQTEFPGPATQPAHNGVVAALDGARVRLAGYVVPIGFDGVKVSEFLLVPFVGACVHVPPPPPNQIVLVEADTPFEAGGMFDPVQVTGTLRTATTSTQLAEVGYHLSAERVEKYQG